jgi:hypothetical protein
MGASRWQRFLGPPLALAILGLAVGAGPVAAAGEQATIDVNQTAFNPPCDDDANFIAPKMLDAAVAAYKRLGYGATGFTGAAFTRAHVLARTVDDWGFYVHSHGDLFRHPDGQRYTGFREDAAKCVGAVVYSKDIKAKRNGRQSNLVFISTCHSADPNTTMPDAFAIEKIKAGQLAWNGPEFYVGYVGLQWDSDEWVFEQRFWDALAAGMGVGAAFDYARKGSFRSATFQADWWGSYVWSGRAGLIGGCPHCV